VAGSGRIVGKEPALDPDPELESQRGVGFHPGVGGTSFSGAGSSASKSSEGVAEKKLRFVRCYMLKLCK
jgi:hypothetical protein